MYSPTIEKLIKIFSKFPTIGPKTAARFVFYLNGLSKEEVSELIEAVSELKKNIKTCSLCFKPFESSMRSGHGEGLCEICSNLSRDRGLLCVVEKETDLESIEKTKKFKGLYFILGGTVSTLKKSDVEKLRIRELESRIKNHPEIEEIILAINPTTDGEATTLYLERLIKNLPAFSGRVTRLGRGLPVGGELEYADGETLSSALENRK